MPTDLIANKYKIVREIARSNDIVYEAVDTTMGRRLAVKELNLPPNLTGQARRDRIERFNREARAAGKLAHPNIVTVYAFGEHDGRHFIAMEYLEGQTLRDALQARGALPVNEALEIASQVLSGLAHAHARQVVHRDVKPDNIQLLPGGQVKLTDFGIARMTEEASLTGEGQVFGTPSYMSPEQIKGEFIDARSDLFSLGIVLYEMLAGRKPFTGDSVVSITYSIMHNDPPALSGVSYGVEQVIFRALSKEAHRRFNSADEMRTALANADSVPSMFFPRPPTNMSGFPASPPPSATAGGAYNPYPGAVYQPGSGPVHAPHAPHAPTGGTVYAPPAQVAQPTGGGPFVNWGAAPGAQPPGYAPPPPAPFPRRPAQPLMSEGARTTLGVFLVSILLGVLVVGFVLLFLRAYDQQQKQGPIRAAYKTINEGATAYNKGDMQTAEAKFRAALNAAPDRESGDLARVNLANTYLALGKKAYDRRDFGSAEQYWSQAYDLDPKNETVRDDLSVLYRRLGRQTGLPDESGGTTGGGLDPSSPGHNDSLDARRAQTQALYQQFVKAFNSGDIDRARTLSEQLNQDPASEEARRATEMMQKLDQRQMQGSPYLGGD